MNDGCEMIKALLYRKPMGGHIIQKWYECSSDDQDHDRCD